MIVKVHKGDGRKIVVIVDSDLVGKKFEEGVRQLDLTADFYNGEEKTKEEVLDVVTGAHILHIVGKESVGLALAEKWVGRGDIMSVQGVEHTEVVFIWD
jgi:hypothetical protein